MPERVKRVKLTVLSRWEGHTYSLTLHVIHSNTSAQHYELKYTEEGVLRCSKRRGSWLHVSPRNMHQPSSSLVSKCCAILVTVRIRTGIFSDVHPDISV